MVVTCIVVTFYQLAGHLDEVLDLKYIRDTRTHDEINSDLVAIATNTNTVTILDQASGHCEALEGHKGIVLSLSCSNDGNILISSSKVHLLCCCGLLILAIFTRITLYVFGRSNLHLCCTDALLLDMATHSVLGLLSAQS